MRMLFAVPPGYGLMLPVVPLPGRSGRPYNGGAQVLDRAVRRPDRPRVCVTLDTVVPH